MSDYVKQFRKQLYHAKDEEVYLFGFSFGAMVAFIASAEINPKLQLLCSLSPYFKEDLPHLKKSWKNYFGKKRMADMKTFSFNEFSRKTQCRTILVAGTKEGAAL